MKIVRGREDTSHSGANAEDGEVVSRDEFPTENLHLGGCADRDGETVAAHDSIEDLVAVANILVHLVRERIASVVAAIVEPAARKEHDRFRIAYGQKFENELVDEREDCGVGADAECQRKNGDSCKTRRFAEAADGKLHVLDEVRHRVQTFLETDNCSGPERLRKNVG